MHLDVGRKFPVGEMSSIASLNRLQPAVAPYFHGSLDEIARPNLDNLPKFVRLVESSSETRSSNQRNMSSSPMLSLQQPVSLLQADEQRIAAEPLHAFAFYSSFWPSHPFLPPHRRLAEHIKDSEGTNLSAAINHIGSLYSFAHYEHLAASFVPPPPLDRPQNGFAVQSLILRAISSHMANDPQQGQMSLNAATDIALNIGLHRNDFAFSHGKGIHVIEESWRRTWWELYILNVMFAALNQTSNIRLRAVNADVPLPCEENRYRADDVGSRAK